MATFNSISNFFTTDITTDIGLGKVTAAKINTQLENVVWQQGTIGYGPTPATMAAAQWPFIDTAMQVTDSYGPSHLGAVRDFRKSFKEYSKEEFREMGSKPVVKEILTGLTKLNKEEIVERIREYLKD
jgi:hypothetical protein